MQSTGQAADFQRTLASLRQFVGQRKPVERCELCGKVLLAQHPHLVEPASRKILCSCEACAVLFPNQLRASSTGQHYRRIPRDARSLPQFQLSDGQWESLLIPINVAFFFDSTLAERVVAMYPSPAGPTESLLSFESWSEIVANNPALAEMEPDVEALLVNRLGEKYGYREAEYYVAPIDQCYGLVGIIRSHWRGLSGGAEVWIEIRNFFANLKQHARQVREPTRV